MHSLPILVNCLASPLPNCPSAGAKRSPDWNRSRMA